MTHCPYIVHNNSFMRFIRSQTKCFFFQWGSYPNIYRFRVIKKKNFKGLRSLSERADSFKVSNKSPQYFAKLLFCMYLENIYTKKLRRKICANFSIFLNIHFDLIFKLFLWVNQTNKTRSSMFKLFTLKLYN